MVKRLFDVVCAGAALLVTAPLLGIAALGIKLTDPGPVLFRARRVGYLGREFTMLKLRTMRNGDGGRGTGDGSPITGHKDPRVSKIGRILRRLKIDELPQLFNVLVGDMSIVGPRPEDPAIVRKYYSSTDLETLGVRPGLASPGSIYQYAEGDKLLTGADPETSYVDQLLKTKLALDLVYVRQATLRHDLAIIGRTLWTIAGVMFGKRRFPLPPEMPAARRLLEQAQA